MYEGRRLLFSFWGNVFLKNRAFFQGTARYHLIPRGSLTCFAITLCLLHRNDDFGVCTGKQTSAVGGWVLRALEERVLFVFICISHIKTNTTQHNATQHTDVTQLDPDHF
jgi:hypothetical protein